MSRIFDRRSNLVFAIAVLALVVAMSSTAAYAAVARNSVLSKSIKNGQVKTQDLADSGVTGAKIADGGVTGTKIADGGVAAADLAAGSVGSGQLANGSVNGSKIADGAVKTADLGNGVVDARSLGTVVTVYSTSPDVDDADGITNGGTVGSIGAFVTCPDDAIVLSGGGDWVNASTGSVDQKNLYLHSSVPMTGVTQGWYVRGSIDIGAQGTVQLRARAVCLIGPAS